MSALSRAKTAALRAVVLVEAVDPRRSVGLQARIHDADEITRLIDLVAEESGILDHRAAGIEREWECRDDLRHARDCMAAVEQLDAIAATLSALEREQIEARFAGSAWETPEGHVIGAKADLARAA